MSPLRVPCVVLPCILSWGALILHTECYRTATYPLTCRTPAAPACSCVVLQSHTEEAGAALHVVGAADVFGAYMGEAERRLRGVFDAAARDAAGGKVAVVFLDEVRGDHDVDHVIFMTGIWM